MCGADTSTGDGEGGGDSAVVALMLAGDTNAEGENERYDGGIWGTCEEGAVDSGRALLGIQSKGIVDSVACVIILGIWLIARPIVKFRREAVLSTARCSANAHSVGVL